MLYPFELRAHEHEFNTVKTAYCETRAALARLAESRKRRYLEGNWTVTLSPMGSDFASSLENEIVTSRTRSIFSAGSSVNTLFFPVTVEILCTSPLEHGPSLSVQEQEIASRCLYQAQRPNHRDREPLMFCRLQPKGIWDASSSCFPTAPLHPPPATVSKNKIPDHICTSAWSITPAARRSRPLQQRLPDEGSTPWAEWCALFLCHLDCLRHRLCR